MRALDFGKKVLLVEKKRIGGAAIYDGVLSSKAMWEQALKAASIREMIPDYEPDFSHLVKTVNEAIFERKSQMTIHLQLLQKLPNKLFHHEKGTAHILDKHTVQVTKEDGSVKTVSSDFLLIATGSRPRIPANIKVDEQIIVTSDG